MTQSESGTDVFKVDSTGDSAATAQTQGPAIVATATPQQITPASSRLQALSDLRRRLDEEDLSNKGVQKLLLDMLYQKEAECARSADFEERFYGVDKRVAVQDEMLKARVALDVAFGVGLGVGGAIMGLSPVFLSPNHLQGEVCFGIGLVLVIGGIVVRVIRQ